LIEDIFSDGMAVGKLLNESGFDFAVDTSLAVGCTEEARRKPRSGI
jgi:hypothetical protein